MREFTASALATQSAAVLRIIGQLSDRQVKSISAMAELKSLAIKINYHCIRHRDTIAEATAAAAAADNTTDATLTEQLAAAGAAVGGGQGLQRLSQAGLLLIELDAGAASTVSVPPADKAAYASTAKLIELAGDIRSSAVSLYASLKDCCSVIEAAGGLWIFANTRMGRDVRFMQSELSSGLATLLSSLAHAPADGIWPRFSGATSTGWPAGWVDAGGVAILNASVVFPWKPAGSLAVQTQAADDAFKSQSSQGTDLAWLQREWRSAAAQGEATALIRLATLAAHTQQRMPKSLRGFGTWADMPAEQQVASWRFISSALCLGPINPQVLSAAAQYYLDAVLPCTLQQMQNLSLSNKRDASTAPHLLSLHGAIGTPPPLQAGVLDALFQYAQDCTPQLAAFMKAAYHKLEQAKDSDNEQWSAFWQDVLSAAVLSVQGVLAHANEQRQGHATQPPPSTAAAWHVFAQWAGCSSEWAHFLQRSFESNPISNGPHVSNGYVTADANIWDNSTAHDYRMEIGRPSASTPQSHSLGTTGAALLSAFRKGGVGGGVRGAIGTGQQTSPPSVPATTMHHNEPIPSGSQQIGGDFEASAPMARVCAYTTSAIVGDRQLLGAVACGTFPSVEQFSSAAGELLFVKAAHKRAGGDLDEAALSAGIQALHERSMQDDTQRGSDPSAASLHRLLNLAQSSASRVLQSHLDALRASAVGGSGAPSGGAQRRLQSRSSAASGSASVHSAATSGNGVSGTAGSTVSARLASGRLSQAANTETGPDLAVGAAPTEGSSLNRRITASAAGSSSSRTAARAAPGASVSGTSEHPPGGGGGGAAAPADHTAKDAAEATHDVQGQPAPIDDNSESKDALQRVLNSCDVASEAELLVHSPHASPEEDDTSDRAYSPFDVRSTFPAPQQLARKERTNKASDLSLFVFERLCAEAQERGLLLDESAAYVDSKSNLSVADLEVISDLEHFVHPRASVVGLLETWYGYNLAGSVTHMWGGACSGLGSVIERVQNGREYALKLYLPPDDAADTISEAAHALAREVAAGAMPEQVLAGEGAVGCMQPFSYKLSGPATLIGMSIRQNLRGYKVPDDRNVAQVVREPELSPCDFVGVALHDEYIRASAACLIDLAASLYDPPQFEDVHGAAAPPSGKSFRFVTAARARAQHRDMRGIGAVMQVHLARAMLTASALAGGDAEAACALGNMLDSGVLRPGATQKPHAYGTWVLRRHAQLAATWYAIGAAMGSSSAANSLGHMFVSGKLNSRLPALLMNCVHRVVEHRSGVSSDTTQARQLPKGVFVSLLVVIARAQMQEEGSAPPSQRGACCSPTEELLPAQRLAEAAFWFSLAASTHDPAASNNLAVCDELQSAPASAFGLPAFASQYATAAQRGSLSGAFNQAYTMAKYARSAHELSQATAQMQRLAAVGDLRAKYHLACLLEGSFRKLQRIPQLSNKVLTPSMHMQPGAAWPTLQALARSAETDAVSVQLYMQAAAAGNADAAVKCGHICYSGVATQPRSLEKAILYYMIAALGGNAAGLNALACMAEEGKGFIGTGCTLRAEIMFRLAAGDSQGASILLWEVFEADQCSTSGTSSGSGAPMQRQGEEQLLPQLPLACLAALPVPCNTSSEAQLNLYWLYQKRAKAQLIEVYCGQEATPLQPGQHDALVQAGASTDGMQALSETIRARLHRSAASDVQDSVNGLHKALLQEATYYQHEAAAWLAAAARNGNAHAKRIVAKTSMISGRE